MVDNAGFNINHKKTKVQPKWTRQIVLGFVANVKPNILGQKYYEMRAIIHNSWKHGIETQWFKSGARNPGHMISRINGILSAWSSVNWKKTNKLKEKWIEAVQKYEKAEEQRILGHK